MASVGRGYRSPPMRSVVFVPDASVTTSVGAPGDLALLDRLLKQLNALGVDPSILLGRDGVPIAAPSSARRYAALATVPASTPDAFAALAAAAGALPPTFLFCAAD